MKFQYEANRYVLPLLEKSKMVDLACGKKDLINIARKRGIDAIGLDLDKSYNPEIIHDLNESLPFKRKSFGQVTCVDSLEHVKNTPLIFNEVYRILKNNGIFIVTIPNTKFYRKTRHRHKYYFTYNKTKKLIKGNSFIIDKEIYPYYIPYVRRLIKVSLPYISSHFIFKLRKKN